MIEKILLDYLTGVLDVPVYIEIPEHPAAEYVAIDKTGGGRTNYINTATFAVQSISTTLYKAAELNEAVKTAMYNLIYVADVSRVELNSDYNYTDTDRRAYRYQAVFDITY